MQTQISYFPDENRKRDNYKDMDDKSKGILFCHFISADRLRPGVSGRVPTDLNIPTVTYLVVSAVWNGSDDLHCSAICTLRAFVLCAPTATKCSLGRRMHNPTDGRWTASSRTSKTPLFRLWLCCVRHACEMIPWMWRSHPIQMHKGC